jgi:hypothetical protein
MPAVRPIKIGRAAAGGRLMTAMAGSSRKSSRCSQPLFSRRAVASEIGTRIFNNQI